MKPETVAQALGVKPGVLARKTRTLVKRAALALSEASGLWGEVDGSVEADLEALIEGVSAFDSEDGTLATAIENLGEPWGDQL